MTLTRASIRSFQVFQCVAIQQPAEMDNSHSYESPNVKNEEADDMENNHAQTLRNRKKKAVTPRILKGSILITPDEHDPNNYCKLCKRAYSTKYSYRSHLQIVHKMKLASPVRKPNPLITPDDHDPNNYCKSCKKTYRTKYSYRSHLQIVHKMKVAPIVPKPNPLITPDENDPNFYCKSCKWTFSNKTSYRRHLQSVHKTTLAPLREPNACARTTKASSYNNHQKKRLHGKSSGRTETNKSSHTNSRQKNCSSSGSIISNKPARSRVQFVCNE